LTPQRTEKSECCPECQGERKRLPAAGGGGFYCPACTAKASEREEAEQKKGEAREREDRIKRGQIARYLTDSCLGKRFVGLAFSDYRPSCREAQYVVDECRAFAEGFGNGRSLIFVGSSGTGKNMLSAIVGQEVIGRGFSFLHTSALKVVRRFKDSWKQPDLTEEEVLRYFVTPDLLVIDEIGVQFGSPTEKLYLAEVINDRYEARRSTILLSNLVLKQVEEALDSRTIDRFHEDGGKVLVFAWPSWRRQ
jgi:DNA replication protein DnaC